MMEERNGIRLVVASFGILAGLTGILAGIFEILQGNTMIDGIVISTIGPNYLMASDFTYHAITLIPNFLITGVVAIIVSSLVIVWSIKFIDRKYGTLILLALCISQMLVGGGWVIDMALITCVLATRINKPLNWWRTHLPTTVRTGLSKTLPIFVVMYAIISGAMLVLTVLGVNSEYLIGLLTPLAGAMFIPMLFMIFGGIAFDVNRIESIVS